MSDFGKRWRDGESENAEREAALTAIKRRIVRPKKIRRTEDDHEDSGLSTPGAGPSSPSRTRSRHSSSSPSRSPRHVSRDGELAVAEPRRPPKAPRAPKPLSELLSRPPPRSHLAPGRESHPSLLPCRSVYSYTRLNHIEEGTYGVVFRAKCNETGGIYALKKLKLEEEKQGFPITSLREVMALMVAGQHENVVGVREIVVGDTLNQVFIVMPFIEHDLKTLLADMPHPFVQSEVKTIMLQLLSAVAHCHANWILHRDLKTSNLLMNNRGQIKVADFGLARKFGDPLGEMTQLVVTLWYRAPELLLGAKDYTTPVDMWSVGCIFAEIIQKEALFPGRGEMDQLIKIFNLLGQPSDDVWPGFSQLPKAKSVNAIGPIFSNLRQKFSKLSTNGHNLMSSLLCYDPERRMTAEEALQHPYFSENPLPKHPDLFTSFPSQAAGERRHRAIASPPAPPHVDHYAEPDINDLESFV